MPPDPPRTLAPAARAKNAVGILFSPPNRKNAARSLKGANFCTTLLLFYHTSDWLNQQNLPKFQVHVDGYLFIFN